MRGEMWSHCWPLHRPQAASASVQSRSSVLGLSGHGLGARNHGLHTHRMYRTILPQSHRDFLYAPFIYLWYFKIDLWINLFIRLSSLKTLTFWSSLTPSERLNLSFTYLPPTLSLKDIDVFSSLCILLCGFPMRRHWFGRFPLSPAFLSLAIRCTNFPGVLWCDLPVQGQLGHNRNLSLSLCSHPQSLMPLTSGLAPLLVNPAVGNLAEWHSNFY